jgi:rare lipoprotein A
MRTKLQIAALLVVASLLWTPSMSVASQIAKAHKAAKNYKSRYVGTVSWYGKQHQDRKMANGQRFDRHKLTAASWYFPLGTMIRVVNLENGESVLVTITDRGPNPRLHRILDLSEAAAERLGYIAQGLTSVFLYPMVSFDTVSVELHCHLIAPRSNKAPMEYEARVTNAPM